METNATGFFENWNFDFQNVVVKEVFAPPPKKNEIKIKFSKKIFTPFFLEKNLLGSLIFSKKVSAPFF